MRSTDTKFAYVCYYALCYAVWERNKSLGILTRLRCEMPVAFHSRKTRRFSTGSSIIKEILVFEREIGAASVMNR